MEGPILDLACGRGENGLFLASLNLAVVLADRSPEALEVARRSAEDRRLKVQFWEVDLETGGNPLEEEHYRAILVFHYLYRPLTPYIRKGIRKGRLLIYETFTIEQPKYGHPHSPDYLRRPGEPADWFQDWQIIHYKSLLIGAFAPRQSWGFKMRRPRRATRSRNPKTRNKSASFRPSGSIGGIALQIAHKPLRQT